MKKDTLHQISSFYQLSLNLLYLDVVKFNVVLNFQALSIEIIKTNLY